MRIIFMIKLSLHEQIRIIVQKKWQSANAECEFKEEIVVIIN